MRPMAVGPVPDRSTGGAVVAIPGVHPRAALSWIAVAAAYLTAVLAVVTAVVVPAEAAGRAGSAAEHERAEARQGA